MDLKALVRFSSLALLLLPISAMAAEDGKRFTVVVMDPLSKPLSCDCVKGYAQRKYEVLGEYLEAQLHRPVDVVWNGSLAEAMKDTAGKADLVIGKFSVVKSDDEKVDLDFTPIASLTGLKGETKQKGLIVVRSSDPAKDVNDLDGYQIYYGTADADEKSGAVDRLLAKHGIATVAEADKETFGACSEAATALLKLPAESKFAAVISSYAEPLLEGCGSVKKGDLRVVAETEEVPFVTAFCRKDLEPELREVLTNSLLDVITNAQVKIALETLDGFVEFEAPESKAEDVTQPGTVSQVKKKN